MLEIVIRCSKRICQTLRKIKCYNSERKIPQRQSEVGRYVLDIWESALSYYYTEEHENSEETNV